MEKLPEKLKKQATKVVQKSQQEGRNALKLNFNAVRKKERNIFLVLNMSILLLSLQDHLFDTLIFFFFFFSSNIVSLYYFRRRFFQFYFFFLQDSKFDLCGSTQTPIAQGKDLVRCPYCGTAYLPEFTGSLCKTCNIASVGVETVGLACMMTR